MMRKKVYSFIVFNCNLYHRKSWDLGMGNEGKYILFVLLIGILFSSKMRNDVEDEIPQLLNFFLSLFQELRVTERNVRPISYNKQVSGQETILYIYMMVGLPLNWGGAKSINVH